MLNESDYEKLAFLRKNTRLGLIAYLKISKLKAEAVKLEEMCRREEKEYNGIDYSDAENLEFKLRMKTWKRSLIDAWVEIGDGLGLDEFSDMVLSQHLKKE